MSDTVSIPVLFHTDEDGFVSQGCPACGRRFMVKFEEGAGDGSDEPISYCPYCRHNEYDCWWTEEQFEHIHSAVVAEVAAPELRKLERQMESVNRSSGGLLSMSIQSDIPEQPTDPPPEPLSDLRIKRFRCCREEVKVEKDRFHYCIICGRKTS